MQIFLIQTGRGKVSGLLQNYSRDLKWLLSQHLLTQKNLHSFACSKALPEPFVYKNSPTNISYLSRVPQETISWRSITNADSEVYFPGLMVYIIIKFTFSTKIEIFINFWILQGGSSDFLFFHQNFFFLQRRLIADWLAVPPA